MTYLILLSLSGCLQRKGICSKLNRFSTQDLRALYVKSARPSTDPWLSPPCSASMALFSAPLTTSCPSEHNHQNHCSLPQQQISKSLFLNQPQHAPISLIIFLCHLIFSSFLQIILLFFFLNSSLHPHCYSACNGTILPL